MLEEATKAGRAAVGKIMEVSGEEREEWVGSVRKMVERGAGTARGGGRGEGGGGGGSGSGVGGVGSVNGFDFEGHLAEQAALEANARIHSQWLSQQLLMAASTPGRLTLPLPTASTSEVYKEQLAGIVERDAVANTSKVNQSVKFHSPVTAGGVGSEGGGAGGGGRRVMQQTPYSAAADMNTTNASAVDMSMASVGGGRGTYEFRVSKEIFRGVGLESKMKVRGTGGREGRWRKRTFKCGPVDLTPLSSYSNPSQARSAASQATSSSPETASPTTTASR